VRGEGRIVRLRTLSVGLALWAVFAFMIVHAAECAFAAGAGSHGGAHTTAVAHTAVGQAHSEAEGIGPAGHRCHHDAGHQHMGAGDKLYASSRRMIECVAPDPAGLDTAGWSAADALIFLRVRRRGPPPSASRSSLSGRHILISTCVART
jgi:hypothetical protein